MMNSKVLILLVGASMMLSACQPSDPGLTTSAPSFAPPVLSDHYNKQFEYSRAERTAVQKDWEKNEISVFLKAFGPDGKRPINDLKEKDLVVKENGVGVTKFTVTKSKDEKFKQVVELALVIDVTGTMVPLIETAKRRLHNFVADARAKGYHSRVCFASFGDYTVKPCDRFYDNNPDDPSTEKQMEEFLTKLAQLRALKGADGDPGWPDLEENPLRALIDVSKAPWSNDSQRFVILVTDWGFLYQPTLPGDKGLPGAKEFAERNQVPTFPETIAAIKAAKMKVFTVTRTKNPFKSGEIWDGYSTPFQGSPSIVEASGGDHYNFDDVLNGRVSLDAVLQNILNRIESTFKVTYETTQNPGLSPELPLNKRNVVITSSRGTIKADAPLSTRADGQESNNKWNISEDAIQPGSLWVWVDGKQIPPNQFSLNGGDVILSNPPKPKSNLRFSFFYQDPSKNFRVEPIALKGTASASNTTVVLNGKPARAQDLVFNKDVEGATTLRLAPGVLSNDDPYGIRDNQGLHVQIRVENK